MSTPAEAEIWACPEAAAFVGGKRYSDALLAMLLKARRPEWWRNAPESNNDNGAGSGPTAINIATIPQGQHFSVEQVATAVAGVITDQQQAWRGGRRRRRQADVAFRRVAAPQDRACLEPSVTNGLPSLLQGLHLAEADVRPPKEGGRP